MLWILLCNAVQADILQIASFRRDFPKSMYRFKDKMDSEPELELEIIQFFMMCVPY